MDTQLALERMQAQSTPVCKLCGGKEFGPGPGGRLGKDQRGPHCLACGSLERQRVGARVLQELHGGDLEWRRALLLGTEHGADPRWFAHCDAAPSVRAGSLPDALAGYGAGSIDFIGMIHMFEYLDRDREAFARLLRLLSPRGVLQVGFADPHARPWTAIQVGPPGSVRRWYGRDLGRHFRCDELGVEMRVHEAADPVTGMVLPVHMFHHQP
ncbi:class I SAM-dependent methyltransferase [Massilia genomosp. 1]|uniref:Methyltransferase type 11 domain-containing protein n=1 Tax=Massilia genomosp. 1 TaxID=2609280 RepID=A0ABX0MXT1_9BURK|nr:class I SAM-dependent methyltransferase [Massilia genomosp. 1]NHZ64069.1 hypothetical protein [Massilia genomosp. 1]